MTDGIVLVLGSADEVEPVVAELRASGVRAWSDSIGRASADFLSLDWADALIVIDSSEHLECRHRRPLVEFRGPTVVAVPSATAPMVVDLLGLGFDAVMDWPTSVEEMGARVRRLLARA